MKGLNLIFCIIIFFLLLFDRFNIFLFCIISSLIHESVHIILYILFYKEIPKLKFSVFGISLKNDKLNQNKNLIIISLAPISNLFIAIIGLIFLNFEFRMNIFVFSYVNLIIGLLNLLPIEYLDGGRILDIVFINYPKYSKILNIISILLLFIIALYFTSDKLKTIFTLIIFTIYYLINIKKT